MASVFCAFKRVQHCERCTCTGCATLAEGAYWRYRGARHTTGASSGLSGSKPSSGFFRLPFGGASSPAVPFRDWMYFNPSSSFEGFKVPQGMQGLQHQMCHAAQG
eukprot:356044-Chlamydomonas_euryale.AAC.5